MKMIKKISALLLGVCLLVPCFSMIAAASDGRISFSDPETKVGDEFEVKCAVRSSVSMGSVEVTLAYDTGYLRFVSGDNATDDGSGTLTLSTNANATEQIFQVKFQALQEGETKVTISGANVANTDGTALTLDQGNSTIQIAEGDPSKIEETTTSADDVQVEVNGQTYTLTDKFSEGDIPTGYEKTTVNLDGQDRQMVTNATSGVTLGYLVGSDNTADFFVFNTETATFSPYAEISISDMSSIVLMSDTSSVSLPEEYQEATLTLGNYEFPVWQSENDSEYYVLYATNSNGEQGFYRYDPEENTYQRFTPETDTDDSDEDTSLLGKVQKFISDNIQKIVLFGGLGALLILLIIIILFVKLHNRNAELDDLYEEFGLNDEEPKESKKDKKKNAKAAKKEKKSKKEKRREKDDFDDDFEDDDFDDDDFADDDFETDEMDFETEDMGLEADEPGSATDEMDFETMDMALDADSDMFETEEMEFSTEDFAFNEEEAPDEADEADFETSTLDLGEMPEDDLVVYGGVSRTEELTIDDLDDLLNEDKKKDASESEDSFTMDFIDLD